MTTFTEKVLAEGQLSDSKTTLYTATAVRVNVRFIRADNITGGNGVLVYFFYKKATSRRIIYASLDANESLEKDDVFQLDSGDLIEGYASTPNAVDYIITGVTVA